MCVNDFFRRWLGSTPTTTGTLARYNYTESGRTQVVSHNYGSHWNRRNDGGVGKIKMEERLKSLEDKIDEHIKSFKEHRSEMRKLLLGNGNRWGIANQVRILWYAFIIYIGANYGVNIIR